MIVAITGGRGLIGRNVIKDFLSKGFEVRSLTRSPISSNHPNLKWFVGDLHDSIKVLNDLVIDADIVCHCAGEIKDESLFIKTNYEGTINLVEASIKSKVKKFIHISSVGVYGKNLQGAIIESDELNPMNAYEKSKILADQWLIDLNSKDIEVTILRPSVVFDVDMKNKSLKHWIESIYSGHFFFIGGKNSRVNYVHVEDVKDAINAIVFQPISKNINIYNLSYSISVEKFVKNICTENNIKYPKLRVPAFLIMGLALFMDFLSTFLNVKLPLSVSRVKALNSNVIYDSSKIANELNFFPKVSLEKRHNGVANIWLSKKKNV